MPLPAQLSGCISDLTKHVESLANQRDTLLAENASLKARLNGGATMAPDPDEVLPGAIVERFVDKSGDTSLKKDKDAVNLMGVVPQPQPRAPRTPSPASPSKRFAETAPDDCKDDCIAASKLGMLKCDPDTFNKEPDKINTIYDALSALDGVNSNDTPLQWFVKSIWFQSWCTFAIAANTIYIALAADLQVKNGYRVLSGLDKYAESIVPDIIFTTWFSIEIILRVLAEQKLFFTGDNSKWNLFDTFLVSESLFSLLVSAGAHLSFLRILRVFRLVRVVRVVRTFKALRKLRTTIFSIANCFVDLMWALLVIILIVFIFSIIFCQAVSDYFLNLDGADAEALADAVRVHADFGSLYTAMVSLWSAISGGNDWMGYGELLRLLPKGELYFFLFNFYIAFCTVGLLNVVTGIFVDSAVCTRTDDEVVERYNEDLKMTTDEVRRIFMEADTDGSGTMDYNELKAHLQNPWVRAYFSGLDIDPSETKIIFTLMDLDNSGEVSIDEFVNGTMKLKGHAKSLDLIAMMYDSARHASKFNSLCHFVEEQFNDIRAAVCPDAPASMGLTSQSAVFEHGNGLVATMNNGQAPGLTVPSK